MKNKSCKIMGLFLVILLTVHKSRAYTLSSLLEEVQKKNKNFQSFDIYKKIAKDRKVAGDVILSPQIMVTSGYVHDKKQPNMLGASYSYNQQNLIELGKKFSTGTSVAVNASLLYAENPGTFSSNFLKYGQGSLGISLSQSLWKDFLGRSHRLRWQREDLYENLEFSQWELQQKMILLNAEMNYWNYLYKKEEVGLRKASLLRAQKIADWAARREKQGIGERADTLSTQALVESRRLQLQNAEDDFVSVQNKIKEILEIPITETLPEIHGQIDNVVKKMNRDDAKISYDAYFSQMQSEVKSVAAQEVEEAYRPDLSLDASYNTNSWDSDMGKAMNKWTDSSTPTSRMGIRFVYLFGTEGKNSSVAMAQKEALAARLQSERKILEGRNAWSELCRHHNELLSKIESAQRIAKIQQMRAKAEADRYEKGRSITSNVINSEQDAAEAELNYMLLKVELKKIEAQSALFI